MTQNKTNIERLAELNSLFLTLDDRGQDSALIILRSLDFAQSVMCSPKRVVTPQTTHGCGGKKHKSKKSISDIL